MKHYTLLQVAPYAHIIAWGVPVGGAMLGGAIGAIIALRTRHEEDL